jgi:sugar-phosphatase
MDGLLVDSEPLWCEAEMRILGGLGVPLTAQRCGETRGMVASEVAQHWYRLYPWEGPTPDAVAAEIIDAMAALLAGVVAKPGARHAVTTCRRRGLALAVASSSPRRLIDAVVDRLGWATWFSVLHSASEEAAGKPDPAVFLTTARLLGVDPDRCVVFEDSAAGVRAANAAGMVCVAVPENQAPAGAMPDGFESDDVVLATLEEVDDDLWVRLADRRRRAPAPGAVGSDEDR